MQKLPRSLNILEKHTTCNNMETHAQELHKTPGHGWKHYLFEFFMLFLAVSLGFYAENLREEIKNNEEIKTNMRTILADLKSDVTRLDSVFERNEYGCTMADSLIILLHQDKSNTREIYYCARTVTSNVGYYYSNSKTFEQMKNSGLLKLIKPRALLDSLAAYYVSFQWLANQTELVRLKLDAIHKENEELFDGYVFHQMMKIKNLGNFNGTHLVINRPEGTPALISTDFNKINAVLLNYHYYYTTVKFYNRTAALQNQFAKRLIEFINKEYSSGQ
jgi:hypothetical protein